MRLRPGDLHVGADTEKVVVSPHPLTMRTGRAVRRRLGSVVEVRPVPASGRTRRDRADLAVRLGLALLFLAALLIVTGVPWPAPLAVAATLLVVVVAEQARKARTPLLAARSDDDTVVLSAPAERAAFRRALETTRRIRSSWPALGGLVDPVPAEHALTRSLAELAALLSRREEIGRWRAELAAADVRDLPPASTALLALTAQRRRVEQLRRETTAAADRLIAALDTIERAGLGLLREQRVGALVRVAEPAVSRLGGPLTEPVAAAGLAERTATVLAAYRELTGLQDSPPAS